MDVNDSRHDRSVAVAEAAGRVDSRLPALVRADTAPVLVVLSGLPGSGKSYLARRLRPQLAATVIETDFVRRILFPHPRYTGPENGWVYTVCHELVARRLGSGQSVIFDATNLLEHGRRELYRIADRAQARLVIVRIVASDEVIRGRLRQRTEGREPGQNSDADVAVYEKLRETEQPIRHEHLVIDSTQDVKQNVRRILSECHVPPVTQMAGADFDVLEHTADIALRVRGDTPEDLYANAARGMFAQMVALERVPLSGQRRVRVEGDDNESLLVAWLSELLYLRDVHGEAYARFDVRFPAPGHIDATVHGSPWTAFDRPVKAVTYHGLKVEQVAGAWQATIVFDV